MGAPLFHRYRAVSGCGQWPWRSAIAPPHLFRPMTTFAIALSCESIIAAGLPCSGCKVLGRDRLEVVVLGLLVLELGGAAASLLAP